MPQVPIIMPQLGESIAEATIVDIKVKPGDDVVDDQEIIDVETNKAVMGVTTPCKGKIDRIAVQLKETYPVGAVLGYIEASEEDAARFAKHAPPSPPQKEVAEEIPARADQEVVPAREKKIAARDGDGERAAGLPVPAITKGATFLSPRVRARMAEMQLTTADLAGIMGTGAGNRVTIKDLESFLHKMENQTAHEASKIRAGVADAMRRSWTRPLSTIGVISESRSGVARSAIARSETRPRALRAPRTRCLRWQKIQARRRNSSATVSCNPSRSTSASQ